MIPAVWRYPLPPAFNLILKFLCTHDRAQELMRCAAATSGLAYAHTSRHTTDRLAEFARSCAFTAMAQPEAVILQQMETQEREQQQTGKDQPLQQGVSVVQTFAQQGDTTGFKKTFYKRKLPSPPAIEFSSPEGRQLFQEALIEGSMTGFFKLMEQFNTQDEPAFCGLASMAMVLNALSIDPRRTWKGSWRWFHEAMLDCCRPLDVVKKEGITLYQASCLARCNGARVELRPYGNTTLEQFRSEVQSVCRSGEEHIVVSYSRKAFLQTGDGHFSPIGGYHREKDLVLVLDVARFKYPPHWVPLPLLYEAMSYTDPETGRPRGYMRLASNPLLDSILLTLDLRSHEWRPADQFIRQGAPALVESMAAGSELSGEDVVRRVIDAMPLASLDAFLIVRSGAPLAAPTAAAGTSDAANTTAAAVAEPRTTNLATAAANVVTVATGSLLPSASPESLLVGTPAPTAAPTPAPTASSLFPSSAHPISGLCATASLRVLGQAGEEAASTPLSQSSPAMAVPAKNACGAGGGAKGSDTSSVAAAAVKSSCGRCSSSVRDEVNPGGSSGGGGGCSKSSLMAAAAAVFTAQDRCIPLAQRQQLLHELRGMPLFTLVTNHLASKSATSAMDTLPPATPRLTSPSEYLPEKVAMALLMQRPDVWPATERWRNAEAGRQWHALLGPGGYSVVEAEAAYLREQLQHIDEVLQSGDISGTCGEHSSRLDCAAHGH